MDRFPKVTAASRHSLRHLKILGLALAATIVWSNAIQADTNDDLIIAHLEFLGYACDIVEQGIRARHNSKIHLLLSHAQGGILIQTGFPGKGDSGDNAARYAVLNAVNARMRVGRTFWTSEGHLFVSAWMPGTYEKPRFAAFMDAWEQDGQTLREFSQKLKSYLTE